MKRFTVPPTASRLVGLITIEALSAEPQAQAGHEDATLQQLFIHLAAGTPWTGSPLEASSDLTACRFESQTVSRWGGATRISADLDHLTAQLQLALTQTRGKIAGGC